jgi:hypothetical protein
MNFTPLDYVLWLLTFALELSLLLIIRRNGLSSRFPVFASFLAFKVARSIGLFMCLHNDAAYFWTYWITKGIAAALIAGCLVELMRELADLGVVQIARFAPCIVLLSGLLSLAYHSPVHAGHKIMTAVRAMDYAAALATCGVIVYIGAFTHRIPWRSNAATIFFGFALFNAAYLAQAAISATTGKNLSALYVCSYLCAIFVWLKDLVRADEQLTVCPVKLRSLLQNNNFHIAIDFCERGSEKY